MVKRSKVDTCFDQVVRATTPYLGPAAERFVARQVRHHLNKEPSRLTKRDLQGLVDWLGISLTMLTGDEQLIRDYRSELHNLSQSSRG